MEEVINYVQRACELAQKLESNQPNWTNQPAMLSLHIDEIVKTLSAAKERLLVTQQDQTSASYFAQVIPHETQQLQMDATPMQNYARTMDHYQLFQMQQLQAPRNTTRYDVRAFPESKMRGSEVGVQAVEASSSQPRRSSRKGDLEKRIEMVPAPQYGNTEMPQDDGFTWKKYGQKDILGSKYPRSYYRCTHQKLYECQAKKQVQRLDHNPSIFEVTYRGNHTCHMTSTAPSTVPTQQLVVDISQDMTQRTISPQLSPSSASASGQWLSTMNLSLQVGGGGMAPAIADASSGSAGPSTSRYVADYPVVDMVDAMFNSGSSCGNSMESLFPSH